MWGCTREGGTGGLASLSLMGEAQALHTGRGGGRLPWVAPTKAAVKGSGG